MSSERNDTQLQENPLPRGRIVSDGYLGVPRSFPITSAPPGNSAFTAKSLENGSFKKVTQQHGKNNENGARPKKIKHQSTVHSGLTILPWDTFIYDPRNLKDLFLLERSGVITYDPEEVNVFFHASRMMRPSFGDVSENGQSW